MMFLSLFVMLGVVLETHVYRLRLVYITILAALVCLLCGWYFLWSAPSAFPQSPASVVISSGSSLAEVAETLHTQHVIRSRTVFIVLTKLFSDERGVQAGTYLFSKAYDVSSIVYRVTNGVSDVVLIQVTFPEGTTVREMADILASKLSSFDKESFLKNATPKEGYLFPDTYRFTPTVTSDEIISIVQNTFNEKTKVLARPVMDSGHTFSDTVIMASILEREARSLEEKRIVAGILWKRIKNGMPLQVDAVFGYIKNRDTYSPSFEDLQLDSPYNTYRKTGLPPGPISNPGLDSFLAAVTPIHTSYVYYLTGKDGQMHYAKTFEEHKQNRAKYLD